MAQTDVLVVGAGPTGLVAACELARRGVRFRVIDKLAEPTDESRAVVVHARSLEMFETVGTPTGHTILGVDAAPVDVDGEPDLQQVALDAAAAARIGAKRGERVVVRPDGYIGAIADDEAGVAAYFAALRGVREDG